MIFPGPAALGLSGVDGIYRAENDNKQKLVLRETCCIDNLHLVGGEGWTMRSSSEIIYWGHRGRGMDELLNCVDPEGEVYIRCL